MKKDWRRRTRKKPRSSPSARFKDEELCARCEKPQSLCVCDSIQPLTNEHFVVVLQHPQEPDKILGTAKILTESLEHSKLKVALSVSNLKKILGTEELDPKRWGVLYLGSGIKDAGKKLSPGIYFTSKDGELLPPKVQSEIREELEGIVLLDGTWSQAKALWWRNPWLLKLRRMILVPAHPSLYRELRKEPRPDCVSTLETAAEVFDALGEKKEIAQGLRATFSELLKKYRDALKTEPAAKTESAQ